MNISTNQKGFAVLESVLIILILAAVGGTGFYVYNSSKKSSDNLTATTDAVESDKKETIDTVEPKENQPIAESNLVTSSQGAFSLGNLYGWTTFGCKDTDGVVLLPKPADGLKNLCYTSDLKAPFRDLDYTYQAVIAKGQNPYMNPDLNGDFQEISYSITKNIPGKKLTYSADNKATGETVRYHEYLFELNGQEYTAYFFESPFWDEVNSNADRKNVTVQNFEKMLATMRDESTPKGPRG